MTVADARRPGRRRPDADDGRGFALYVHWPFCASKCPYCDFNSHVREHVEHGRWRAALMAEMDHYAALTGPRRLTSLFFGGGTPSLMEPATVEVVIGHAGRHWSVADDVEITLEANPTSVEAGKLAAFRGAGVNRASLGVQSLDDSALRFLGRRHDAAEALAALDTARSVFDRVSFDLIYARPGQSVADWRRELAQAVDLGPSHLSVYQLTIEPGTPFRDAHARGDFAMPDPARGAALYQITQDVLEAAGLPAYEISNHARPGLECRHNLTYWRYGEYVGIGPGAHGRIGTPDGKHATRQHRAPEIWLAEVEARGHATRTWQALDEQTRRDEMAIMGLRLTRGITRSDTNAEFGAEPEALFDETALATLVDGGFLVLDDAGLRATAPGRARLDSVLARLLD